MHILSWQKRKGDPCIAGKIKDDIEEFGYGSALVRIQSDQEPAIVDVQRAVIAKRGSAPTIPESRWRFSIQRTSGKFNQEGSKYGAKTSFKFGIKMGCQSGS